MTYPQQTRQNYSSPSPTPAAGGPQQPTGGPAPHYDVQSAYANYQGQPNYGQGQPGYAPQPNNCAPLASTTRKGPILGMIAVGLALLGSFLLTYPFIWVDFVALQGLVDSFLNQRNTATPDWVPGAIAFLASGAIVGFAGFVVSIVAIVVKRGRVWGIVGLIGCVVFPFLLMILFIAMNPTLAAFI